MARRVARIPRGFKKVGPMSQVGQGSAPAIAATLDAPAACTALLKTYFEQHAIAWPADFDAASLVFRTVAFQENTPQPGWGTLTVEFGYRPLRGKPKAP